MENIGAVELTKLHASCIYYMYSDDSEKALPLGYSHDERKLTGNMCCMLMVVMHVILTDNLEKKTQQI